ncbi:MAG TPA: hypothetical protein VLF40_04785 [Candidatus Saccharimonadales bacterium]|nr:hypothetical protein [Candidatus Saccharimonadales bacterium]
MAAHRVARLHHSSELSPPVAFTDAGLEAGELTGYMSEAAREQHAETLSPVPADMDVADICGDGREPTGESAARINTLTGPDTLPLEDGYASIFGGPVGKAIAFMAAGVATAQTREQSHTFLRSVGGLHGAIQLIRMARGPRSILHSDIGQEGNSLHFASDTGRNDQEVGCLYNGSLGRVLEKLARHRNTHHYPGDHHTRGLVRQVSEADLRQAFGNDGDKGAGRFFDAFGFLLNELEHGKDHAFGRNDYINHESEGTPIVILGGVHPSVKDSCLFMNFHLDQVGNAFQAHRLGLDPYRGDPGRIALGIGDLLAEYDIPAEAFLKAAVILSTAVRSALVAVDADPRLHGQTDPRHLPLGIIGDARTAAAIIDAEAGRRRSQARSYILPARVA